LCGSRRTVILGYLLAFSRRGSSPDALPIISKSTISSSVGRRYGQGHQHSVDIFDCRDESASMAATGKSNECNTLFGELATRVAEVCGND
jgi:hypothetical protein